jgi:membrane protease YdiL (CAAX protease family)
MVFFVIQAVVVAGFMAAVSRGERVHGAAVLMAFSIAGALTYLLMRSVYAKANTANVPRILGAANQPLLGIAAGLATGLVALCYLYVINTTGLLDSARNNNALTFLGWWALPLALVAAPLFEEFIFRGLIFGGLRRSFGLWPAALASAAIFAILHPAISLLPVFIMGMAAALVYDRTRSLLAPMLTHVGYNACVIGAQWLLF